jgi:queuosine precursor transporter
MLKSKKDIIFVVLAGFFVTNAIVAEMISSKLGVFGPFTAIVGLIPWPVVFLTTDIINEYYGKEVVKKLSYITVVMIAYSFIILYIAMSIQTSPASPANEEQFNAVFGQSMWVILGSICAFFISQLVDVYVAANHRFHGNLSNSGHFCGSGDRLFASWANNTRAILGMGNYRLFV